MGEWGPGKMSWQRRDVGVLRLWAAMHGQWRVTLRHLPADVEIVKSNVRAPADRPRLDEAKAAAEAWVRDFAQGLLEAVRDE